MNNEKTILIMRHAKSSWDDSSLKDIERPLNERGRKDAPAMGRFLADLGLIPDYIVCSTATRARETIQLLAEIMEIDEQVIRFDATLYYEGTDAYVAAVRNAPEEAAVVLVAGHNPSVEQTVARLSGGTAAKKITTANIACFYTSAPTWEDFSEVNTTFKWLTGPKDLL
ncbi:SixA phosphatase family protein [Rhodohalobacter sp. 8-1]|uniref:SixA phosphatase family protein n=1 Tax=Rhodohalobacter sp. 8-1 TaxID=3131972 RepID=UPI0030EE3ED2